LIRGKIVLTGQLKNISPLHIGNASNDRSDMDVLLDKHNKPFIPASSLCGILRHKISLNIDDENYFWGFKADKNDNKIDGKQSIIKCMDLECEKFKLKIRDGIKINNQKGLIDNKFDYEIVEPGAIFNLKMEFSFTDDYEQSVKRMASTFYTILDKSIQIGAKTNSGFGKVKLIKDNINIYLFDFKNKEDVYNWLTQNLSVKNLVTHETLGIPIEISAPDLFTIEASLQLKNSIIVRSYSDMPDMPDSIHIQSNNKNILPGTSIKGAIRARAERIAKSLGAESIIDKLFGYVDTVNSKASKARIKIKEVILPNFVSELQTRIQIDRFTGGTIKSALFDSMPLFVDMQKKVIKISISIPNCSKAEAGLLLLVLKDLWTGDLAVGGEKNIGRGVFKGIEALVKFGNDLFILDQDLSRISIDQKKKLQTFVDEFVLKKED